MHYRTIFLSDIHLGTRGCSAAELLSFLKDHDADTIYLIGDIIDGWQLANRFYWPQLHNDIVQKLLRCARKGTRIVYVLGNHDEFLRKHAPLRIGGIDMVLSAEHHTADGRRLWITHGDQFDCITSYHRWLAVLGDIGYSASIAVNRWFNGLRRKFGLGHWSLSGFLKRSIKEAVSFISNYETAVEGECSRRGYDGVVCGHINHAELRQMGAILYCNTGDVVESCTALVEHADGGLEVLCFRDGPAVSLKLVPPPCA